MLRFELKRAFINLSFLVAIIISLVSLGTGLYSYGKDYAMYGPATNPQIDPFLYNTFDGLLIARFGFIGLLAPLIAALPYAASFAVDSTTGYIRPILLRSKRSQYMAAKLTANFLAGAIAVAAPHIVIYGISALTFPEGLTNPDVYYQRRIIVQGMWETIYWTNPSLYVWLIICLSFLFGGVYATLGMAAGCISDNRYIALAAPFLIYVVGNFVLASSGLVPWSFTVTFMPQQITNATELNVFGGLGIVLVVSLVVILVTSFNKLRNA